MNFLRYSIGVILIVAIPSAIVYWFLIHPFVRFWRRIGIGRSYVVICAVVAGVMGGMFHVRERLLTADLGTSYPLIILGLVCLAIAGWLLKMLRKQLPIRVLIGVPELAPDHATGAPITDGVYAHIRHPRYVQMTLALLGYTLIANYPAVYGAFLLWCAGIYAVVILEERELRSRFGKAYREYCRRVPRFVPRCGKRS